MTKQQASKAICKAVQFSAMLWESKIKVKGKTMTTLKATVQRSYKGKPRLWQISHT